MPIKRSCDEIFLEGAIKKAAEVGIENLRTKDVAKLTGFSEGTLFKLFGTKEVLLRKAFLHVDRTLSRIVTESPQTGNLNSKLEISLYSIWHKFYRHLIENKNETIFFIRYRYSSLYTDEVRAMRTAYNGGFSRIYEMLERELGKETSYYRDFLLSYVFETTLCFAEKVITGKISDTADVEYSIWTAVYNSVKGTIGAQESLHRPRAE